jgi:hypothetical protein
VQAPQQFVGYDPIVMDGYDNVTAVYQNTSLITGPGDVQAEKDLLLPYVQETDAAVAACAENIPAGSRAFWAQWVANWKKFYATKSTIFSASDDLQRVRSLRADLNRFRQQIATYCPDAGLQTAAPDPNPTVFSTIAKAEQDLLNRADKAAKDFNTTARVAIVVGGILVGWLIYAQWKAAQVLGPHVLKNLDKLALL